MQLHCRSPPPSPSSSDETVWLSLCKNVTLWYRQASSSCSATISCLPSFVFTTHPISFFSFSHQCTVLHKWGFHLYVSSWWNLIAANFCLCTCMCVHACVCTCVHVCLHLSVSVCVCIHINMPLPFCLFSKPFYNGTNGDSRYRSRSVVSACFSFSVTCSVSPGQGI